MKNLAKAIIQVMTEVKGIDKTLNVGAGHNSYKGVADKDVKLIVGAAMVKAGLCILPIAIKSNTKIKRWVEEGGQYGPKQKQQVFNEVITKYLLLHESGESMEIVGSGHGVDSQDKAAGKATTYALKYALLYTFLVPTGTIQDTDNEHSDNKDVPVKKAPVKVKKIMLTKQQFDKALSSDAKGIKATLNKFNDTNGFAMLKRYETALTNALNELDHVSK